MLSFTIYDCCGFLCVSQVVSPANSVYASNTKDLWDCYWCEFSFVFRRLARVKAFLHPSHTKHITSVDSFVFLQDTHLCICKEPAWINALLHISHTHTQKGLWPVWTHLCLSKSIEWLNPLLHTSWKALMTTQRSRLGGILLHLLKVLSRVNVLQQTSHAKGWWPKWILLWLFA